MRALYEDSAVPVAEIARRAGVTERTIYKYAAKEQWTPRYRWTANGSRPRCRRAGQGFALAKGAGGRFIRRADKGKPFARGLKATDPDGAARAIERCGEAALLSRQAQREAEAERRCDALNRAIELNNNAIKNLCEFHRRRDKEPTPVDDRLEDILTRLVMMAQAQCEALVAEEEAAAAPSTVRPRDPPTLALRASARLESAEARSATAESGDPALYSEKVSTGFPLARE